MVLRPKATALEVSEETRALGRKRRSVELGLILLAFVVISAAYVLASLAKRSHIPVSVGPFLGLVFAVLITAHIANRRLAPRADGILLPVAVLLNGLGYVVIARLNEQLASKQAGWTVLGIVAFVVTLWIVPETRRLQRLSFTWGLVGVVLLMLPLIPKLGYSTNGARIWIRIPPFTFQPGELAKVALALFFASYLVDRRQLLSQATFSIGPIRLPEPKHLLPVVLAWGFALVVMVFERDLGSALLFFMLFMTSIWIATGRAWYPIVGIVMFALAGYFAWTQFSHVQERVSVWFDAFANPADGYQIIQGTYSLAWGGIAGTGLGLGTPGRVPFAATDYIFTAVGEELGLLGTTAILGAFLLIVGSGMRIATTSRDAFHKLLAAGISILIGIQAFVIIGGILRVLPLTGVTLPFVSYGGSSLLANYVLLALLIRISDESTDQRSRASAVVRAKVHT